MPYAVPTPDAPGKPRPTSFSFLDAGISFLTTILPPALPCTIRPSPTSTLPTEHLQPRSEPANHPSARLLTFLLEFLLPPQLASCFFQPHPCNYSSPSPCMLVSSLDSAAYLPGVFPIILSRFSSAITSSVEAFLASPSRAGHPLLVSPGLFLFYAAAPALTTPVLNCLDI